MSVYSTTPGPPARIRIVAHPPLGPLRAWLPLPTFSPSTHEAATIKDLLQSLRAMLRTSSAVTVELEGEKRSKPCRFATRFEHLVS